MASWLLHLSLNVKQSGFKPWLGTLCCVLGHNTELWEVCGLMVIALVSKCQAVWVQALAGDIVLCSGTQHFTLSVPLSQPRCINGYWLI